MIDAAAYEKQLKARLAELEGRLDNVEEELEARPDPDWDDNATAHEQDEVLEDLGVLGQHEIRAIKAALDRVKNGTYGKCVKCGDEISKARLDLIPYTPFCKHCAR